MNINKILLLIIGLNVFGEEYVKCYQYDVYNNKYIDLGEKPKSQCELVIPDGGGAPFYVLKKTKRYGYSW